MARTKDSLDTVILELVSKVLKLKEEHKEETERVERQYLEGQINAYASVKQRLEILKDRLEFEQLVSQPSELLPCPFCGSNPTIGSLGGDKQNWMIYCEGCKIPSAEMGVSGESLDDIKNNWNKRVSQ